MPDDVKVTESAEPVVDNPADEALGFKTDTDDEIEDRHGEFTEGLDIEKKPAEKKTPDEPVEKDEKEAEGEPPEDELDEGDEDIKRGREILTDQEKEDADKAQEDASRAAQSQQEPVYDPLLEQHDAKGIEFFRNVVPKGLFPKEPVSLPDGTVLDFASLMENEPELPVMVAVIANNLIKQMVKNGYLVTADSAADLRNEIDNKLFMRTLTNKLDGVPEARKIYSDPKFKEFIGKEPKEVQALMKSDDPYDHIRVFKRFLNKAGIDAADKKVVDLDKKRAEAKANFDGLHKTTVKSKGKPKGSAMTPREEEMEGFASKDEDDEFYR